MFNIIFLPGLDGYSMYNIIFLPGLGSNIV